MRLFVRIFFSSIFALARNGSPKNEADMWWKLSQKKWTSCCHRESLHSTWRHSASTAFRSAAWSCAYLILASSSQGSTAGSYNIHYTLLSPSGVLGIGLVWDNLSWPHPTDFLDRLLKSSSNWNQLSMMGPQLLSGWYQMVLDVFWCSQLFSDVFSWVVTLMHNHPLCRHFFSWWCQFQRCFQLV